MLIIIMDINNIDLEKLTNEIEKIQTEITKKEIIQITQPTKTLEEKVLEYVSQNQILLHILTPCYGGLCYATYTRCLIDTVLLLKKYNINIVIQFMTNESLISRARNNLIGLSMLNKNVTHFMFIDSDITWNPSDILRLIISDKPIIGGVYPKKTYFWNKISSNPEIIRQWIDKAKNIDASISESEIIKNNLLLYNINYLSDTNVLNIDNNEAQVQHLATGFMMIKRYVLEEMMKKYPETKYTDDTGFLKKEQCEFTYALFDCGIINDHYYSEDWLFCHRWSEIGGSIWVDIGINLTHTGTENYSGSFIRNLLSNNV